MLKKSIHKVFAALLIVLALSSCSEYQKILKSADYDFKYEKALEYYQAEDYFRAQGLLEDLLTVYRGTTKGEDVYYYYAQTYFKQADYVYAGHYFDNFIKTFPMSHRTEECAFNKAMCYYLQSPSPLLDQTPTNTAIEEFQYFMVKYPASTKRDTCNLLIDEMKDKLIEKSFLNAKLYYDLENYKASVVALENSLNEFPNTKFREEIMFLIARSNYELAKNSVYAKQRERYTNTVDACENFILEFPESKHLRATERIQNQAKEYLQK